MQIKNMAKNIFYFLLIILIILVEFITYTEDKSVGEKIFLAILLIAALIGIGISIIHIRNHVDTAWKNLAQKLHATYHPRKKEGLLEKINTIFAPSKYEINIPKIEGKYKNHDFKITGFYEEKDRYESYKEGFYTKITFYTKKDNKNEFEIQSKYDQINFDQIMKIQQKVEFKEIPLTEDYIINAKAKIHNTNIIDEKTKERLTEIKDQFKTRFCKIVINKKEITFEMQRLSTDKEFMLKIIDILSDITDNCEKFILEPPHI